jgi:hypothetical protein
MRESEREKNVGFRRFEFKPKQTGFSELGVLRMGVKRAGLREQDSVCHSLVKLLANKPQQTPGKHR